MARKMFFDLNNEPIILIILRKLQKKKYKRKENINDKIII